MSKENPKWGASRIHGELLMLGFEVAQSTVSEYMVQGRTPPSTMNTNQWNRRGTFLARRSNDMSFGNGASISADTLID